jgi:hypothetical protein
VPVKIITAAQAEWPAHLPAIGKGAPKEKPWAKWRQAKDAYMQRERMKQEMERAALTRREMEAQLIAEAEEAARMTRWRRRQLEAL